MLASCIGLAMRFHVHGEERGDGSLQPKISYPTALMHDTNQSILMHIKNIFVLTSNLTDEEMQYADNGEVVRLSV